MNNKDRYFQDKKEAFSNTENVKCSAYTSEDPGAKASQILYYTDYYYFAEPYNITRYKLLSVSICMCYRNSSILIVEYNIYNTIIK